MRTQLRAAVVVPAVLVSAAGLLAAGCGSAHQAPPAAVVRGVALRLRAASPGPYGAADTAFGLDLLAAWCRQDPQANILFSPQSLASGLGMAYLGARGATAAAMAGVLHLPAAGRALLAGLQARSGALRGLDGPGVQVASTNQVWADPSLPPLRSYLDDVATGYGGGVRQVPLLRNPDKAAAQVDAAIAAATRGHIGHLLTGSELQGVGWVLTDALQLNARWATPFQAARTAPGAFTTAAGRRVTARFMSGTGYRSDSAGGWTAVDLPYRGGKLSMLALLPGEATKGCPALTATALRSLSQPLATLSPAGRVTSNTAISLPRVSLHSHAQMNGLLGKLGMGIAFGPAADFTGLSPQAASIAFVMHAATLQVAERGTVASAATAVGLLPADAVGPGQTVSFDRPYLLVVTDTRTGEPLMLARVANPSAA